MEPNDAWYDLSRLNLYVWLALLYKQMRSNSLVGKKKVRWIFWSQKLHHQNSYTRRLVPGQLRIIRMLSMLNVNRGIGYIQEYTIRI